MSIQGLSSLSPQGITGVTGLSRTEEERRRSRNTSGNDAALDPRAGFDASLDAMLTDAPGVTATRPATSATAPASGNPLVQDRFTRAQDDAPATYNAAGRLNTPQTTTLSGMSSGALASEPTVIPQAATAGSSETGNSSDKKQNNASAKLAGDLSAEEEKQVEQLRQRDQEVRAHEQAHQATGGEHAGGISYTYQRGPDNRQYAVGGSVPIDVSPVADDPEATVAKAEKVRAAAMAPASPSGADQQVAAKASQMAAKARVEQSEKALNPEEDENGTGLPGQSGQSEKSGKPGLSGQPEKSGVEDTATGILKAEKAAEAGLTSLNPGTTGTTGTTGAAGATGVVDKIGAAGSTEATNAAGAASAAGTAAGAAGVGPLLMPPRPATAAQSMPNSQDTPRDGTGSLASPSEQATRAAFAALHQMGQSASAPAAQTAAQTTAQPDANPEVMRRALGKASAAYARVRGETGLAPLNTGISMAV